ncbi:MAG: Rid family hydrolase [Gemmatimonadota bacterium]|nr:Rid family hydrolase [Gemmatimonadota bacterium]MDH5760862.1 Rid family hydrolase [Gemmatimonadota bacterium]
MAPSSPSNTLSLPGTARRAGTTRTATALAVPALAALALTLSAPAAVSGQEDLPTKTVIQPANYRPSPAPLSPAILVGNTLYLSGATGGDPVTGRLVEGGFEAEFHQIMANYTQVLTEAGMDFSDVVQVVVYLTDMDDYQLLNRLYREYFTTDPLPVRAAVAVKELARGARIELMMTAVKTRD